MEVIRMYKAYLNVIRSYRAGQSSAITLKQISDLDKRISRRLWLSHPGLRADILRTILGSLRYSQSLIAREYIDVYKEV